MICCLLDLLTFLVSLQPITIAFGKQQRRKGGKIASLAPLDYDFPSSAEIVAAASMQLDRLSHHHN
jgi:hypothetical protein